MICISLPLIAGIADRAAGTSAALTGPELMTENGCLTEQGSDVFWDRATLYALRGIFYTGNPDKALEILHRLSQRRLLGDHVLMRWKLVRRAPRGICQRKAAFIAGS